MLEWLVEPGLLDGDDELFAALSRRSIPHRAVSWLEYNRALSDEDFFPEGARVFVRGSIKLARDINRAGLWTPGAVMNEANLLCSAYYPKFGGRLLNRDGLIVGLGELYRRREAIAQAINWSGEGKVFVRPDSNNKAFHAGIFDLDKYPTIEAFSAYLKYPPSGAVLIARPQEIKAEWRVFVSDRGPFTGSLYLLNDEPCYARLTDGGIFDYVRRVVEQIQWAPDPIYTMDIAETATGLHVLEIGCASCSGSYASDQDALVEEVMRVFDEE